MSFAITPYQPHQTPAGAVHANQPCAELLRQHARWKAARARLDATPKRIAASKRVTAPIVVATKAPQETAQIPGWGNPSDGRRNGKTLKHHRLDILERIVAAAPGRERKPINPPRQRSYAYRAVIRFQARDIVHETAVAFGLTVDDLMSPSHAKETSAARLEAMYRIKRELLLSFQDVAKVMNRIAHTTIRFGCAAHAARLAAIHHSD